MPRPLYPRERPGTHCTGGWVGPRAGLDVCEKSHPYRDFFLFISTNTTCTSVAEKTQITNTSLKTSHTQPRKKKQISYIYAQPLCTESLNSSLRATQVRSPDR